MSGHIKFNFSKATETEIINHLLLCDTGFVPPLSERVEIYSYAHKIVNKAVRFEAWSDDMLVGLVAAYCNDSECKTAFISNVSVLQGWQGKGIASCLMKQCIVYITQQGFDRTELEVDGKNACAIDLYKKMDFVINKVCDRSMIMYLNNRKDRVDEQTT